MEFRRLQPIQMLITLPFLVHTLITDNNIDFSTQAGVTNEQFSQVVRVSASDLIASETNVDQAANAKVCLD
jgi:hypothetical protein